MKLVVLDPLALFRTYRLTTSSGKHLEEINHAHIVCLMYKLITSRRGSDDLSNGLDRSRDRRKQELTKNKKNKRQTSSNNYVKIYFWFC